MVFPLSNTYCPDVCSGREGFNCLPHVSGCVFSLEVKGTAVNLPEHLLIFSKHRTSVLAFYHIVNAQHTPDGYCLQDMWLVLLFVQPHRRLSINFIAGGIESILALEIFPSLRLYWIEKISWLLMKSQSLCVLPHVTPSKGANDSPAIKIIIRTPQIHFCLKEQNL